MTGIGGGRMTVLDDRTERDMRARAEMAAVAMERLIALRDPDYRVTPEAHDAMVRLVQSVAALFAST